MKYKSEAMEAVYEQAVAMYKTGGITEARMREYDEMCLKKNKAEKESSAVYSVDNSVKIKHISHVTA